MTDVVVPLVAPFVATIALIATIRSEAKKLRLGRQQERRLKAEAILSDVLYGTDLFQLIGAQWQTTGQINAAHLAEFRTAMDRMFEKILSEPEIGRAFYDRVRFASGKKKLFLLLAECRIRTLALSTTTAPELLVYFTLMTLQYIYDADRERRKETYSALDMIRKSDPSLYDPFMVDPATPALTGVS